MTTEIVLTRHVRARAQQRLGPTSDAQLIALFRTCRLAGKKARSGIRAAAEAMGRPIKRHKDMPWFFDSRHRVVFVGVVELGKITLITCWKLDLPGRS